MTRSPQDELQKLARRLVFWIVSGSLTGMALVGVGLFAATRPGSAEVGSPSWWAGVRDLWPVVLGFGVAVLIHAADVYRDRRTFLRVVSRLRSDGASSASPGDTRSQRLPSGDPRR